ncbi:hypothetical protein HOL52_00270 [bacterium]|jgi:hypothetical protein|nr:hypothetical protein [bacterium]
MNRREFLTGAAVLAGLGITHKLNTTDEEKIYEVEQIAQTGKFVWLSVSSGIGIAIDVAIATLAMWKDLDTREKKLIWTGGVGLSHIFLPILSGSLTYGADKTGESFSQNPENITRGISSLAAAAVYNHTINVIKDEESEEEFDFNYKNIADLMLKIWAVSADAFATGPAKYKQTQTENWSANKTLSSVCIGGMTVMSIALMCLKLSDNFREKVNQNPNLLNEKDEILTGKFINEENLTKLEVIILNYFGANALINGTFKMNANFWTVNGINLLSTFGLYKIFNKEENTEN